MRLTAPALALLTLVGCGPTDPVLASWEGVYALDRATQNSEACDVEGEEIDPGFAFFEIVTEPGIDADLVDLRSCQDPDDCSRVGFSTFLAFEVSKGEMIGSRDEVFYSQVGDDAGLCQALHEELTLVREGKSLRIDIESGVATDVIAESEEICWNLVERIAEDPEGCDAYRVYEARKAD